MVSVIITTYNRNLNVLKRAIKSVLNQTYKELEIIIVDNNIGDLQGEIENYAFKNNFIYISNKNIGGIQRARNRGIKKAKGKYIAFLDDDDQFESDKLETLIKYFNQNVGMVFSKGYIIKRGKKTKYYNNHMFRNNVCLNDLLYRNYIGSTSNPIILKEAIIKVGMFDEKLKARQDLDLWIRIAKEYKVVGVDRYLFTKIIDQETSVANDKYNSVISLEYLYQKYDCYYNNDNKLKAKLLYINMLKYIKYRHIKKAVNNFALGLKANPKEFVKECFLYPIRRLK